MSALGTIVPPGPLLAMLTQILPGARVVDCFESEHGIHGQAWTEGESLHILSVIAMNPGTGQFHRFMDACKAEHSAIYVWQVMNPDLRRVLRSYGFKKARRTEVDGEMLVGFKWKRPSSREGGR